MPDASANKSGFDLTGGLITLGGGLLSGLAGLGQSPQQADFQKLFDTTYNNMNWLKQLPFSKEELFNQMLPVIQKSYTGAADVAAGRIGAATGEGSRAPLGQTFMDYYVQNLAPVIAQWQDESANAYQNFIKMYSQMDQNSKGNFLNGIGEASKAASGVSNMTDLQKFMTNFIQGGDITNKIYGNLQYGSALNAKAQQTAGIQ